MIKKICLGVIRLEIGGLQGFKNVNNNKSKFSTHTRKWSNLKCGYFAPKLAFPQFEISQEFLNKKMSHLSLKTYFLTAKIEKVRFLLTRESSSVNKNLTLLLLQLENRFKQKNCSFY